MTTMMPDIACMQQQIYLGFSEPSDQLLIMNTVCITQQPDQHYKVQ